MISQSLPAELSRPPAPDSMPETMISELRRVMERFGWTLIYRDGGWFATPYTRH